MTLIRDEREDNPASTLSSLGEGAWFVLSGELHKKRSGGLVFNATTETTRQMDGGTSVQPVEVEIIIKRNIPG